MARLATVTLLLGAHEAGTAHLQNTLLAARERLAAEGVGVIGPRDVRKYLSVALQPQGRSPTEAVALARAAMRYLCPEARHIVVMEENLLGTTQRPQLMGEKGLLYPFAMRRLAEALDAFGGAGLRLGLAIRNPATFLPACWLAQLAQGPWQSFRDYAQGMPPAAPRWAALTNRMLQVTPALTFWRFEDYPAALAPILDWATGLHGFGASLLPTVAPQRPGLSQRAANHLHARLAVEPARDHRLLLRRLRWSAPLKPGGPAFEPWTEAERARFDAIYADDLLALATTTQLHQITAA